jgi:hypothetical protein
MLEGFLSRSIYLTRNSSTHVVFKCFSTCENILSNSLAMSFSSQSSFCSIRLLNILMETRYTKVPFYLHLLFIWASGSMPATLNRGSWCYRTKVFCFWLIFTWKFMSKLLWIAFLISRNWRINYLFKSPDICQFSKFGWWITWNCSNFDERMN